MTLRIVAGVITYRRPELLKALLASLQAQEDVPQITQESVASTPNPDDEPRWELEILVVDNDPDGSAKSVVEDSRGRWPIRYVLEPEPGIPSARQRSVEERGPCDAFVFVDDDEVTPRGWLSTLLRHFNPGTIDVVTGPVRGILPDDAPQWARDSDMYTSVGRHRTLDRLDRAYTNNTVVSDAVLDTVTPAFDTTFRFTGSSDLNFFQRVHRQGFSIVWDDDAVVEEAVPPERVRLGWFLRRAYRSGAGDSISRRRISPGVKGWSVSAVKSVLRIGNGAALLAVGLVRPPARIKGLRRMASGVGSVAGLFGMNYEEYRRES